MKEEENILRILNETKRAFQNNNSSQLKHLSNQTINTASLTQDADNIAAAVIVYSLSKIIERQDYKTLPGWNNFYKKIILFLDDSIGDIKNRDYDGFRDNIKKMRSSIESLSGKLKRYIKDVFRNSEINKASRIHEHGISMEQTANLLGITMYELADYVGRTGISDVPENQTMSIKSRIKLVEEIFA
jgi:hypothetical protein